jgi:uncharacterized protein (DUF1684 family)
MDMETDQILSDRTERDRFLREHYASPLPEEHRDTFGGLAYFPVDGDWEFVGKFEPTDAHYVQIPSTAGMENPYTKVGVVTVSVEEVVYHLTVLDDGDGDTFIPFRDGTCGSDSYEGGRYVGLSHGSDSSVTIDFNLSRNPWCVYDEEFICPLPPAENWITASIQAGEKMYRPSS